MQKTLLALTLLATAACVPQLPAQTPAASDQPAQPVAAVGKSQAALAQEDFHVRYISGVSIYIDGGRNAGLAEGTILVLKQDPKKGEKDPSNAALEPGIVGRFKVVSVASTSAVCEVESTTRPVTENDLLSLPDSEVEKLVEKNTLGNTRKYPMVVSFSEGDPLDEEVRDTIPRPPLPEVNEMRGRIGFDMSTIRQIGQGGGSSNTYGMIFRADFTRMWGTHWNLNGYWRGNIETNSGPSQQSLQDLINRTYVMSLSYVNPESHWTAGMGRLYLPGASSLQVIDGGYFGRQFSRNTMLGVFGGSTPDPTAWNYNPNRQLFGAFYNAHGGSYEGFHYSTTVGGGMNMLSWSVDRPFAFAENDFSFKRFFSVYHSMQIDKPTANPGAASVSAGLGQSLLSLRFQVHPRVVLDITDTYFRDVPTYDPALIGTGLLDKYLYQGINGGARVQLPLHITTYFSVGDSSTSSDKKSSLNEMFGVTMSNIWKTGLQADVRYSKFNSAFASGTYRSATVTRDINERLRINLQGGQYAYNSSLAANSNSYFVNMMAEANLGARYFLQSAFTTQRGGTMNYNQWMTTVGFRFDNRTSARRVANANRP